MEKPWIAPFPHVLPRFARHPHSAHQLHGLLGLLEHELAMAHQHGGVPLQESLSHPLTPCNMRFQELQITRKLFKTSCKLNPSQKRLQTLVYLLKTTPSLSKANEFSPFSPLKSSLPLVRKPVLAGSAEARNMATSSGRAFWSSGKPSGGLVPASSCDLPRIRAEEGRS